MGVLTDYDAERRAQHDATPAPSTRRSEKVTERLEPVAAVHVTVVEGPQVSIHDRDDPQYWLDLAEDARRQASQMTHPPARREMLQVSVGYRLLARRAEELAARKPLTTC